MNKLIVGLADKTDHLFAKPGFLLIDDGPVADAFLSRYTRAKVFDPLRHSFNPFPMPYARAREFASVLYGDEGKTTLTARNGKRALTRLLVGAPRLDQLAAGRSDADLEAAAAVDDLLLSPVIRGVFCNPTNFTFRNGTPPSSIVARLDRAAIGEHDARVLGSVLIAQFPGQIIVPDFGFYARDFHASLIREGRLIAGVYSLAELDGRLRQLCLLMEKVPLQCTADDAETIAKYEGLLPHTVGHTAFVEAAIEARPSVPRPRRERKEKPVVIPPTRRGAKRTGRRPRNAGAEHW